MKNPINRKTQKTIKEIKMKLASTLMEVMREKGLSYRETAEIVFGQSELYPQLHKIVSNKGNPTLDSLILIFDRLDSLDKLRDVFEIDN